MCKFELSVLVSVSFSLHWKLNVPLSFCNNRYVLILLLVILNLLRCGPTRSAAPRRVAQRRCLAFDSKSHTCRSVRSASHAAPCPMADLLMTWLQRVNMEALTSVHFTVFHCVLWRIDYGAILQWRILWQGFTLIHKLKPYQSFFSFCAGYPGFQAASDLVFFRHRAVVNVGYPFKML